MLLLLLPQGAALPLYAVDTGADLVLSTLVDDPRANATKNPGQVKASDVVVWSLRLDPALEAPIVLDGLLNATAVFDGTTGGAAVSVTMSVETNGTRIANGTARNLTVIAGMQVLHWSLPVAAPLPAGPLWWNITATGHAFFGPQLRVQGGETYLVLPDVPMPGGPLHLERGLAGESISLTELGDGSDVSTTYTWPRNGSDINVTWDIAHEAGNLSIAVFGPDGASLFAKTWGHDDAGWMLLDASAGEWRIIIERSGFIGSAYMTAQAPLPLDDVVAPRARSTPLPPVLALAALAIAWKRSPRSGV